METETARSRPRLYRIVKPAVIVAASVAAILWVAANTLSGPAHVQLTPPKPPPPTLAARDNDIVAPAKAAPARQQLPMSPSRAADRAGEWVNLHPATPLPIPRKPDSNPSRSATVTLSQVPQPRSGEQVVPNPVAFGSSPPPGCVPGQSYDAGGDHWFHTGHDCRWYRGRHSPHRAGE